MSDDVRCPRCHISHDDLYLYSPNTPFASDGLTYKQALEMADKIIEKLKEFLGEIADGGTEQLDSESFRLYVVMQASNLIGRRP